MGYPGSLGHYDSDMATLASWGVDMLKLDWCNSDPNKLNTGKADNYQTIITIITIEVYSARIHRYLCVEHNTQ